MFELCLTVWKLGGYKGVNATGEFEKWGRIIQEVAVGGGKKG